MSPHQLWNFSSEAMNITIRSSEQSAYGRCRQTNNFADFGKGKKLLRAQNIYLLLQRIVPQIGRHYGVWRFGRYLSGRIKSFAIPSSLPASVLCNLLTLSI